MSARAGAEKRDQNYMNTSPGAAYDANRNKRLLQKKKDAHYDGVDGEDEFHMNASASNAGSDAK